MTNSIEKAKNRRERRKQAQGKSTNTGLSLNPINPITPTQKFAFDEFYHDQHLFLHGVAGTCKTLIALYLALEQISSKLAEQNKVVIVRSAVPSRDIGFLPGSVKEKTKEYEAPYGALCTELYGRGDAYTTLKAKNIIEFMTTSYVRGLTIRDSIIILEEIQNFTYHEAASVLTRVGRNCRVIISGDFRQSDLEGRQKAGLSKLMAIVKNMPSFSFIEFGVEDIVRSSFVKEFILSQIRYEDNKCQKNGLDSSTNYIHEQRSVM
jgi:phosphate starvation-inducible PhoH-like protein